MGAVFRFICLAGSESNLFGMGKTSATIDWEFHVSDGPGDSKDFLRASLTDCKMLCFEIRRLLGRLRGGESVLEVSCGVIVFGELG